ncbi:hypothetical protein EJ04DRAFT_178656 [Polyplosphaeria fusca]|uniref:Uncharacterized protein n=1 Tax=Polyplosphaeria fusca TaxID=682080 RepID=A0A9P4R3V7_9PLEO|nr:hypothetical protein EJ04DRAFT_178656 [Polyplosphaeria fusca]
MSEDGWGLWAFQTGLAMLKGVRSSARVGVSPQSELCRSIHRHAQASTSRAPRHRPGCCARCPTTVSAAAPEAPPICQERCILSDFLYFFVFAYACSIYFMAHISGADRSSRRLAGASARVFLFKLGGLDDPHRQFACPPSSSL